MIFLTRGVYRAPNGEGAGPHVGGAAEESDVFRSRPPRASSERARLNSPRAAAHTATSLVPAAETSLAVSRRIFPVPFAYHRSFKNTLRHRCRVCPKVDAHVRAAASPSSVVLPLGLEIGMHAAKPACPM